MADHSEADPLLRPGADAPQPTPPRCRGAGRVSAWWLSRPRPRGGTGTPRRDEALRGSRPGPAMVAVDCGSWICYARRCRPSPLALKGGIEVSTPPTWRGGGSGRLNGTKRPCPWSRSWGAASSSASPTTPKTRARKIAAIDDRAIAEVVCVLPLFPP